MTTSPKLFISYSWTSQEYQQWVLELAEKLRADGVNVILDKWDLKPGHDAHYFMEQMVTDESVTKVIIICDQKYATKANQRKGGVGTETQIITPELYNQVQQDKFVPVVAECDENGKPYLPVYLKSRVYIDLSKPERYEQEYVELLRWVFEEPKHVKPPLGKKPPFESFHKKQAIFSVPHARPELFIGREAVLQQLETRLQTHHIVALAGLAGMGKTHTTVQFAYLHRHEYQAVLWLSAANVGLITSEFAKLAPVLSLPMPADAKDDEKFHAVQQWLASHSAWLLIIDNADEWQNTWQAVAWLSDMKGKVLFTTCAAAVKPAEPVKLPEMIDSEAANCLLQRALTTDERATLSAADLEQIQQFCAQTLGGLPLALNQAGAYIEQTRCGLRGYIQRFEQHAMKLLAKPGDAHDPVTTTFDLSLEQVEKRKPAAVELLRICAFLDSDQIAEEIFLQGAKQLGEPLHVLQQDELELDELIEALLRYSLIKRDKKWLSMHRLLQRVMRHQLSQPREYAEQAMNAVSAVFPDPEFGNWAVCERLLPSALACCDWIMEYTIATEIAARLSNQTAYYLDSSKADYKQAFSLYQQSLEVCKKIFGEEHLYIAINLDNLAALHIAQHNYSYALPLLQHALKIFKTIFGEEHIDIAVNLNTQAVLCQQQANYEQALFLFKQALAIREKILGKFHPEVASNLNNLANLYNIKGDYKRALSLLNKSLSIRKKIFCQEHPDIANNIHDLAILHLKQHRYKQALPLLIQSIDMWKKIFGEEHPLVAIGLDNLSVLYREQGDYEQALFFVKQSLAINKKFFEEESLEIAKNYNTLAMIYKMQGEYVQSLSLFGQALAIHKKILGEEHDLVALIFHNLASLCEACKIYDKAKLLYEQAITIYKNRLGEQHMDTQMTMKNYARLLAKLEDSE